MAILDSLSNAPSWDLRTTPLAAAVSERWEALREGVQARNCLLRFAYDRMCARFTGHRRLMSEEKFSQVCGALARFGCLPSAADKVMTLREADQDRATTRCLARTYLHEQDAQARVRTPQAMLARVFEWCQGSRRVETSPQRELAVAA